MMPLGIFSIPTTSTVSYWPARIAPAAMPSAAPPLAQPASTSTIGIPVRASAPSTLWPDATPPYAVPQNAAWNCGSPASASAARTACTPISVLVFPSKRPNGWIPTPAISTVLMAPSAPGHAAFGARAFASSARLCSRAGPGRRRRERPRDDIAGKGLGDERHRLPERETLRIGFGEPGDDAQLLAGELDDAEAVRHLAFVAGRRRGDRGPRPQRRVARQRARLDVGRARVRAGRELREVERVAGS